MDFNGLEQPSSSLHVVLDSGSCGTTWLGRLLLPHPPDGMLVQPFTVAFLRLSFQFSDTYTYLYSWLEIGSMGIKYSAQRPHPRLPDLESITLSMGPLRLLPCMDEGASLPWSPWLCVSRTLTVSRHLFGKLLNFCYLLFATESYSTWGCWGWRSYSSCFHPVGSSFFQTPWNLEV